MEYIPSVLLKHLSKHEVLSDLFKNEKLIVFNQIINEIIYANISHKTFEFTYEHKIAFIECLENTLNELSVSSDIALNLGVKLKHILDR